jgi:hypothetical protein
MAGRYVNPDAPLRHVEIAVVGRIQTSRVLASILWWYLTMKPIGVFHDEVPEKGRVAGSRVTGQCR